MRTFLACLEKEARGAFPVTWKLLAFTWMLAGLAIAGLSTHVIFDSNFPGVPPIAGAFLALIVTAPQWIPNEVRGGTLAFLRRTPGGLLRVFAAKALCALGSIALHALNATLAATVWFRLLYSENDWNLEAALTPNTWVFLLIVAACTLFTLGVSCWMVRSPLVVPGAILLLGVLALPLFLFFAPWVSLKPPTSERPGLLIVVSLLFLVFAGTAFARGLRREVGAWARMRSSLLVLGIVGICVTGWAHVQHTWWVHPSPLDPDVRLQNAYVDPGGRFLYVDAYRSGADMPAALRIDLQEGRWEEIRPVGWCWLPVDDMAKGARFWTRVTRPHLACVPLHSSAETRSDVPWPIFDTRTGHLDAYLDDLRRPNPKRDAYVREARRHDPHFVIDGRPVWFLDDHWETLSTRGEIERLPWDVPGIPFITGRGMFRMFFQGSFLWFDPHRNLAVPLFNGSFAYVGPLPKGYFLKLVLECGWLTSRKDNHSWLLFDPTTQQVRPAPGMRDGDEFVGMIGPSRLLVRAAPDARPVLVDLEDASRTPMCLSRDLEGTSRGKYPNLSTTLGYTPNRQPVFWFDHRVPARLDLVRETLDLAARLQPGDEIVSVPDEDHVIVLREDKRILRLQFGSDAEEVLFPREEVTP